MGVAQLKEMKWFQKENDRLRRTVSDLLLSKLILKEAAGGNFSAPLVVVIALIMRAASSQSKTAELVEYWSNIALHGDMPSKCILIKTVLFRT